MIVNEGGIALVSGCTPRTFSMVASGTLSPYLYMMHVMDSERYQKIVACILSHEGIDFYEKDMLISRRALRQK